MAKDRITRLQEAHPWLLERECYALLVAMYAAITEGLGLRGDALQEEMDLSVKRMCSDTRKNLEDLLNSLPTALLENS